MDYETVQVQRRGAELRIVLNRPEAMNAWNTQFGLDLRSAVEAAADDDEVRAVVITGAGRAFSSGADLKAGFDPTPSGTPDVHTALTDRYHPIITGIRRMPKPVVAAVNGPAVGIGLSLALAADLVIARESAYFLLAFVNIGLVPDGGSSLFVPERVGFTRATEMAMLGERVSARQALEWGLINRVAADDEFEAEVDALAQRLAGRPDALLRGHQAPAQRLALRPHGRAARARGRHPAGIRGDRRLHRGRHGLRGEAPARLRRIVTRGRPAPASRLHILRRRMLKVLFTRGLTAALAGLALAPAAANAGIFFPEKGGSENADKIWTLYLLIFILAWIVFIGVAGALVWAMIKFRARRGMVAAQIHGNTRLEVGWTVGAGVILIFITIFTFIMLPDIKNPPASDIDANGNPVTASNALYASTDQPDPPKGSASINIDVDGQQYVWRFQYPKSEKAVFSYIDMVVPVGMTITLDIRADDVIHSWWIPKLGGKMDAVPGYTNKTWFKIPESAIPEGDDQVVFDGQCAELCGRNHANMIGRVIGLRYPDYKAWVDRKAQEIKSAHEQAAKSREEIDKQNAE